jgi:hypothetical protein
MESMANMVVIGSPSPFHLPQYPTLSAMISYGTILNTIRM